MKKYLVWILLILLVLVLAFSWFFYFRHLSIFQKKPTQPVDISNTDSGNLTNVDKSVQQVVALIAGKTDEKLSIKISDEIITLADIIKEEAKVKKPGFEETMSKISEKDQQIYRSQLRAEAIRNLLYRVFIDLHIKENKILVTEAKVDTIIKEYETMMKQNMKQNNQNPETFVLEDYLESIGITMGEFRRDMTYQAKFATVLEPLEKSIPISTDEEIKAFYDKNKESFNEPPAADIDVLLTDSEEKVDEAIAFLKAGNEWNNACAKFSTIPADKSKLGLTYKDRMPEEIAKVVFDTSTKLNTPYKVQFMSQWYVIKINTFQAAVIHTFDEIKDYVQQQLLLEKKKEVQDKLMDELALKYGKKITLK